MAKGILELTEGNFRQEVNSGITLVDFWAGWCAPCRMIAPVIEELAEELSGRIKIAKVDVDSNQNVASELGIVSIPTLIFFKDGKEVERITGVVPKEQIKDRIDEIIE